MVREFLRRYRHLAVLFAVTLLLSCIPVVETWLSTGEMWPYIYPPFSDHIDLARMHTIGQGHLTDGNAYYIEHADGPPLVIFAGAWLNAVPLFLGISLPVALHINFVLWSLITVALAYWLLRDLFLSKWGAAAGGALIYLQSFEHVWRPVKLQTVYPFYFLFYIALARLMREQSRKNIIFLGAATGACFYFYSYLWQTAVITLGLLFLYALATNHRALLKASFLSGALGCLIGSPTVLYALWLSHISPYFWESVSRLGLVRTHLPAAELVYSGGWIWILCLCLGLLWWRVRPLRTDKTFLTLGLFFLISGAGLWVMEGSNVITGQWLETGDHVSGFIYLWLLLAILVLGAFLWRNRAGLSAHVLVLSTSTLMLMCIPCIQYSMRNLGSFLPPNYNPSAWSAQQALAGPFTWLDRAESGPVVVWSDPHLELTTLLPIYTKHFVLDNNWGMFELMSQHEAEERYLVSQYFDDPSIETLKNVDDMSLYLGRSDLPHASNTMNRKVKICRILFFWDAQKDCGPEMTPQSRLGDAYFEGLKTRFKTDIKPNIKHYLQKYHVSYVLKDLQRNASYKPEILGAKKVYDDGLYAIYKLL